MLVIIGDLFYRIIEYDEGGLFCCPGCDWIKDGYECEYFIINFLKEIL